MPARLRRPPLILPLSYAFFPVLLAAGLLLPGWLLGRALRTPAGATGAFLGSAVLLLGSVLALAAAGQPLDLPHVGGLLAGLATVCAAIAHRRGALSLPTWTRPPALPSWRSLDGWLASLGALGLGAVVLRAVGDPLSGFDTVFRWDFLARQMLEHASLAFYPPVSSADFAIYGWCDGFAPLVSSLYLWTYLCLGQVSAPATAVVVVGPALLLGVSVWQLAHALAGSRAASWAIALLASSACLLWAVGMGQETGLIALALVALLGFARRYAAEPAAAWPEWAGVAAGLGALAREYGFALAAVGVVALAWARSPLRAQLRFLAAFSLVALPWHLRVWYRTGNPLFPHPLGGTFPTNAAQADYLRAVADLVGFDRNPEATPLTATALGFTALLPLALGLAGGLAGRRRLGPALLGFALFAGVWWVSVPYTSGEYIYSLRVLAPTLAVGAVLGGTLLARLPGRRRPALVALVVAAFAVDAAGRSLYLPVEATAAWWRRPPAAWREFGRMAEQWRRLPVWAAVTEAAAGRRVLLTDPVVQVSLVRAGARVISLFSPEARPALARDADPLATLAELRRRGVRFVVVTRYNPVHDHWVYQYPWFAWLRQMPVEATGQLYFVYDLYSARFMAAARPDTTRPGETPVVR